MEAPRGTEGMGRDDELKMRSREPRETSNPNQLRDRKMYDIETNRKDNDLATENIKRGDKVNAEMDEAARTQQGGHVPQLGSQMHETTGHNLGKDRKGSAMHDQHDSKHRVGKPGEMLP